MRAAGAFPEVPSRWRGDRSDFLIKMRHSVQEGARTYVFEDAPVAPENLQPGDIVIYPDWATMYAGNGMLLNANALTGTVTEPPMEYAGEPVGIARPY